MPLTPSRAALGSLAAGAVASAAAVAWHARHRAPHAVQLRHVRIGEPAGTEIRLGFVTDTHVGPTVRAADLDRALGLLMAEAPELLLLGGDYVSESPRYLPEAASVIGHYAQASPLGTFAVFGNHDYSNDAPRMERLLAARDVHVLRNEAASVHSHGSDLWIAGIDDAVLSVPNVAGTFEQIPAGANAVALWHEPDGAEEVAPHRPLLQLSGHSHGGQVRLPLFGHIAAPSGGRRYVSGLHDVGGMPVYTSHGVSAYRPPLRYRCAPEVTLVSLHLPSAAACTAPGEPGR
ncbi:MAG: metallophosphoesterase, partial [Thermomicrobiales bacterium]|nr:metallophosphoesterase [Thermomicrobiales bacterium]